MIIKFMIAFQILQIIKTAERRRFPRQALFRYCTFGRSDRSVLRSIILYWSLFCQISCRFSTNLSCIVSSTLQLNSLEDLLFKKTIKKCKKNILFIKLIFFLYHINIYVVSICYFILGKYSTPMNIFRIKLIIHLT